jgi:hypothetical protein
MAVSARIGGRPGKETSERRRLRNCSKSGAVIAGQREGMKSREEAGIWSGKLVESSRSDERRSGRGTESGEERMARREAGA